MSRKYHTIFLTALLTATLLAGCGGGGGGSSFTSTDENTVPAGRAMEPGRPYTMSAGETIVRNSDDAVVVLETDIATGETVAILQSGSAYIQ